MGNGFSIDSYRTIKQTDDETIIIKKSKFISYVSPAETEEDAISFIDKIRKQHWDATHNCSAYVIGEHCQWQKANDDGEPSGTAGKPILEVIKKEQLTNVVIVVTRYFGGIMLGAGGLIRAYGQAASAGIHKAGIVQKTLHSEIIITIEYGWVGKLENELHSRDYQIINASYTDSVSFTILAKFGDEQNVMEWITDLTNGQANIQKGMSVYVDIPCA